jgi:Tol biopolymer transport system component
VKSNAVAFIAKDWKNHGPSSLLIAHIDGSGERKLVENIDDSQWRPYGNAALKWSPNGRWLSYRSADDLWIVSADGLINRKILSITDKNKGIIYTYKWSPDSSHIAYVQASLHDAPPVVVGLLDVATGITLELSSHQSPVTVTLSWSPDGRYLLLSKEYSFLVFEIATLKFVNEIKTDSHCPSVWYDKLEWAPSGQWFYHTHHGNGRYAYNWTCVSGLDGSTRGIDIDGSSSSPVWDTIRDSLYFVARKTNPDSIPNLDIDLRLMRFDVRTQKQDRLLSLSNQTFDYVGSVSVSPDGRTLETHWASSEDKRSFVILDIPSGLTAKFTIDHKIPGSTPFYSGTYWSPDSQNIIFFAGANVTPDGSFYSLNIETGKTSIFSGSYNVEEWVVSPVITFP